MQVWNVLHAACWKYRMQEIAKNSPSRHHRTILSGYICATGARIDNWKKELVKQQYLPTCPYNMVNFGPLAAEIGSLVLGIHSSKFQRVSRHGSVTALHSSNGRQANFAALNRRRHLYLVRRPSRWALPTHASYILDPWVCQLLTVVSKVDCCCSWWPWHSNSGEIFVECM